MRIERVSAVDEFISDEIIYTEKEQANWRAIEQKQIEKQFCFAFSGHFSAGKSTIINDFIGAPLLPTSPIPTSANRITLKNGPLGVFVQRTDGQTIHFKDDISWDDVRGFGMDGATISSICITAPLPFLGAFGQLVDTPGVDSTDPTHKTMTMDALYTTDVIVYVMEYNHVQSETNLHFLKQLSTEGKPLFLVVNQIDKHDESELAFTTFKQDVAETLRNWGISYQDIYYVSMRKMNHAGNENERFKREMKAMMRASAVLCEQSQQCLKQSFYFAVKRRIIEELDEAVAAIEAEVETLGYTLTDVQTYTKEAEKLVAYEHASQQREAQFIAEWDSLFRQVSLFNAHLTELTRDWLLATQPNFRVGLLFSKKKTAEERTHRLKTLLKALQDQVNSQLVFHLQRSFQAVPLAELTNNEAFQTAIQALTYTVASTLFTDNQPTGTTGREYVYAFTKSRTDDIVRELRRRARAALDVMQAGLKDADKRRYEEAVASYEEKAVLRPYVDRYETQQQKCHARARKLEKIAAQYEGANTFAHALDQARNELVTADEEAAEARARAQLQTLNFTDKSVIAHTNEVLSEENTRPTAQTVSLAALNECFQQERTGAWGRTWRMRLQHRLQQIEQETYTISLFGAFSAGKSSFANALLGDDVLPTSPHPTTATVTTVSRPTTTYAHGTVIVTYKKKDDIGAEVASLARWLAMDLTLDSLASCRLQASKGKTNAEKQALAYLQTLQASLRENNNVLETSREVSLSTLQTFVADEATACLIATVDIYYACKLTEAGMTLVDTPGVHSIHGRHTQVAYQQIERSDAIFYVTYYNHAFSKADAQFLEQLAKMNTHFATNKLYFILNAVDLAMNEDERRGVERYVYHSLEQAGVADIRLYPVSSKQGLAAKKQTGQGCELFASFERYVYEGLLQSLKAFNIELLHVETMQYVDFLEEKIAYVNADKETQQKEAARFEAEMATFLQAFTHERGDLLLDRIIREASELYLYLRERIVYVLRDRFTAHVNVATVQGTTRTAQRKSLQMSLYQWHEETLFFLEQELAATQARLQLALSHARDKWLQQWEERMQKCVPTFSFHAQKIVRFTLKVDAASLSVAFEAAPYVAHFRSAQAFFEQGGLSQMKETAVQALTKVYRAHIETYEAATKQALTELVAGIYETEKNRLSEAIASEQAQLVEWTDPQIAEAMTQERKQLMKIVPGRNADATMGPNL